VAILLVLGAHYEGNPIPVWYRSGWIGVDLFFVLSGFLVAGLLFREYQRFGDIRPWEFLGRRGFKIYPGFYLLTAVGTAHLLAKYHTIPLKYLLGEWLFFQNYFFDVDEPFSRHTWSLAVEEHFYLLLVCGVALTARYSRPGHRFRGIARACGVLLVACPVLRVLRVAGYIGGGPVFAATQFRMDSLVAGVLVSYLYHFHAVKLSAFVRNNRGKLATVSVVLLTPALFFKDREIWVPIFIFPMLYYGFSCVLLLTLFHVSEAKHEMGFTRNLERLLAAVGRSSYSIYLWHIFVMGALAKFVFRGEPTESWLRLGATVVICVAAGMVAARAIEEPALCLRDRLLPSRSGRLPVPEDMQPDASVAR